MTFLPIPSDDELSSAARSAIETRLTSRGAGVSNLDRTLLGYPPVFDAYASWFALKDELVPYIGERAVTLFAHAISAASGARVPAAALRREIAASGGDPDEPQVTETEQLLLDWGTLLARSPGAIPADFTARLQRTFNPKLRLILLAFAGQMAAVALFTTAGGIPLDDDLEEYDVLPG